MGRYGESGSMGVWASGPPGEWAVEGGVCIDIIRMAPWMFGSLGLPD